MKDGVTSAKPITYTRERLLALKDSPLSKAFPKDTQMIQGVTKPSVEPSAEPSKAPKIMSRL